MTERRATLATGAGLVAVAFVIYLLSARQFDAGRGDFFWLADAFLHGRTWLPVALGPNDVVYGPPGEVFVPFAPFPAIALMPLVAVVGPLNADIWEPIVNAAIAAADVGLAMWLVGRVGVRSTTDRVWLAVLLGFSTQIWWVTTRGGVWHTGHLIATFLTLAALIELFGRRRSLLMGLLVGAAFLTRGPLALAVPLFLVAIPRRRVDPRACEAGATRAPGRSRAGSASPSASFRASRSSFGTTRCGSGRPSNPATPWRPCHRGSRPSATRACSRRSISG